jgi:chaperonin GroEL
MIEKKIYFGSDAWDKIVQGVQKLDEAVGSTLGPNGRTVIMEDDFGNPHVTKDGISVASTLVFSDPVEHLAMSTVRQASKKTALRAGDGTTSSIVLAHALLRVIGKNEEDNVHEIKKGVYDCMKTAVANIKEISQDIDNDKLKQVATLSANNDEFIGGLIASAFEKVGKDGVVSVEESYNEDSYMTLKEGTKIDRGYASHHMVTDLNKREFSVKDPLILVCAAEIQGPQQILSVLEFCAKNSMPIIIVANTSDEFVATMILNNKQGRFKSCVVNPPGIGYKRDELLQDLALMTGAEFVSEDMGTDLGSITPDMLGRASKVVVKETETVLFIDEQPEEVDEIKKYLHEAMKDSKNEDQMWHLRDRLSKLTGGVATINVGASTEVEMKEKKDRVDDAISASRIALKEGVLPGGGAFLMKLSSKLKNKWNEEDDFSDSYKIGWNSFCKSMEAPVRRLLSNSYYNDTKKNKILKEIESSEDFIGYNIKTENIENLVETGIIDPTAVTINVLENAVSVVSELITTDCVITNVRA